MIQWHNKYDYSWSNSPLIATPNLPPTMKPKCFFTMPSSTLED